MSETDSGATAGGPSPSEFHPYEVEVVLTVYAPSRATAEEALVRSGIRSGELIGEAVIDSFVVYGDDE